MKEYFQHLDLLKGLAILLMVMGHSIAWSFPDWSFLTGTWSDMSRNEFYASFMWKIIYSFHMPLLFFVSGFLFYKSNPLTMRTVRDICFKRVQRLLIPYLTTGVFVYLLKGYFGYWFFIVLFILNIIVLFELYFEQKLRIEGKSEFLFHIIMFIGLCVSSRYYTDYLPKELSNLSGIGQYYLVFIFGYLIHKHSKFETLILSNWSMAISFISYILLVTVIIYYGQLKPLKMMIPLLAITFLYALMKKIASEDKQSALGGGTSLWKIFYGDLCFPSVFRDTIAYVWKLLTHDRQFFHEYKSTVYILNANICYSNILFDYYSRCYKE